MYGDTEDARTIDIGDRSFLIDRDPSTPDGWLLRESYRDGWPVMGGPFPTAENAIAYIDTSSRQARCATTRTSTATSPAGCSRMRPSPAPAEIPGPLHGPQRCA